ncbi:hypothetical protein GLOTRDRAFT_46679 [Gloeophyllum trabeum ATCC 11539]|uniref:Uncharacterized protein n=1 Tax=Gloeophyllum trabeum (strain ATCC 11539 / FP-39264 / Madison 617) TaxID=670483 RepID=S7REV6_GLOTA|nr:uncharacterized protein GLOTRDRAFT_46679 [Gloeophyllum trabeum ATCC 11539]EPQ52785.1 hypothetical protein GLOTRDRAFT_46679 [Gloeophyllum trabeum ATCC 11539]
MEKEAPPLSEEFPEGSKVFFLGEHAYGVAAQITGTTQDSLSVVLAFFPSDKAENEEFKSVVRNRMSERYYPSFNVAEIVGASSKAIAKITSSFMVITSDGQKVNLGLSLKFEAKGMKVIDYSRKNGRFWEFSEKAVQLIRDYKAKAPEVFRAVERSGDAMTKAYDVFSGEDSDKKVKDLRTWLATKGVRDFEPVSLFCDQLKKETVKEIEGLQAKFTEGRSPSAIKKAIVKGIPRQAVLKPSHAVYRLQNQRFGLGDRVTMVRDSGSVPLSAKGVVIALNAKSMDVVWDVPFMAGTTLGGRCSPYRGSTVEFNTCLNLTDPQYVASTKPRGPPPHQPQVPFKPRFGPYPAVRPPPGQAPVGGFHPAPAGASRGSSVQILANPNRGRGAYVNGRGTHTNGRGAPPHAANGAHVVPAQARPAMAGSPPVSVNGVNGEANHLPPVASRGGFVPPHPRGFAPRGGRGFSPNFRGRGGMPPVIDRGRGGPFRGPRGRGRGAPPVAS